MLWLWLLLWPFAVASFVDSSPVDILPANNYFKPFAVYVAIDEELKIMKFFINTEVGNPENTSTLEPLITDVNKTTNRYTTLHVKIDFMGKRFVSENVRFCHAVAVKNTSAYNNSARYHLSSESASESATSSVGPLAPTRIPTNPNEIHYRDLPPKREQLHPFDSHAMDLKIDNSRPVVPLDPKIDPIDKLFQRDIFGPDDDSRHPNETAHHEGPPLLAYTNTSIENFFSNDTGQLVQCPLYQNDSIVIYYQVDISDNVYKFGSYSAEFTVVTNDEDSIVIGGASSNVTPSIQPSLLKNVLFYGILALYLATYFINSSIIVISPYQESSNPFLIEASAICNKKLLEQLSASSAWFVSYLQFALFAVGLDISYPGFLQYLMAKISWCALLNINLYHGRNANATDQYDNVFVNFHNGGVKALVSYASNSFIRYSWPNFIVSLSAWIGFKLVLTQAFIFMKVLVSKRHSNSVLRKLFGFRRGNGEKAETSDFNYSLKMNFWAIVGQFYREFIVFFGYPFLVLTSFMLRSASDPGSPVYFLKSVFLEGNAFNSTIPYEVLQDTRTASESTILSEASKHGRIDPNRFIPVTSIVFGSLTMALWYGSILFFVYHYLCPYTITGKKNKNIAKLYTSLKTLVTWAYIYNQYEPSKVGYVVVDILSVVFPSLVVGVLQDYPKTQVILLLMIELLKLTLVFTIWPFYLKMRWYSMAIVMQVSRVVVIFLNIPYIRELGATEQAKTNVAYVQLFIHFFICCYYIGHLVYCLGLTIVSVLRISKPGMFSLEDEEASDSSDSLEGFQFEQASFARHYHPGAKRDSLTLSHQSSNDQAEVDYYRSKSEKLLQAMDDLDEVTDNTPQEAESTFIDTTSISQIDVPTAQKDYTSREADKIYQKYFLREEIDPEVKELWDKRDWALNPTRSQHHAAKVEKKKESPSLLAQLRGKINPPKVKGFEVVNRPPLKVRPPPDSSDDESLH